MGNLAADPEMRTTPTGKVVTSFPLATNNEWRDSEGARQRTTDFHRIISWQGLAQICGKNLKKGSAVYVEGRLHNRSYEDKSKTRHYVTEITADNVNFIHIKKEKEGDKVVLEDKEDEKEE